MAVRKQRHVWLVCPNPSRIPNSPHLLDAPHAPPQLRHPLGRLLAPPRPLPHRLHRPPQRRQGLGLPPLRLPQRVHLRRQPTQPLRQVRCSAAYLVRCGGGAQGLDGLVEAVCGAGQASEGSDTQAPLSPL